MLKTTPVEEHPVAPGVTRIAKDVYRIPLPTDFPVGDVNAWFIDGPEPAMVDCGVAGQQSMDALEVALHGIGRRIEDLRTLLLTHTHVDHAGNARAVQDRSGCEVFVHRRGAFRLKDLAEYRRTSKPWFVEFMERSGYSKESVSKFARISDGLSRYALPCPETTSLEGGDFVTVAGGRVLEVHEAFGHSTDHVDFRLADTALLFSGDHVLPDISANPTLEAPLPEDVEKPKPLILYRESLSRIAALHVSAAAPAHGLPFQDCAGRCQAILEHQDARCERVHEILRTSGPMNRKELGEALFGKVRLWDIYLVLSETTAALELLEQQGQIRVEGSGPVDRFGAV